MGQKVLARMGQKVLRKILLKIKNCDPNLYAIIFDETTDDTCTEQHSVSIKSIHDVYDIRKDSVGLFALPDTTFPFMLC